MDIVETFIRSGRLTREGYAELLAASRNREAAKSLQREAVRLQKAVYGNRVYVRGLIEFTNYCKNNCYYCGIRKGNRKVSRCRLDQEEILACCERGYALGLRTFVLQGGEDPWYTDARMADLIQAVKERWPDCALTLSVGERSRESYRMFREAGADRYLLRQETADERHYGKLHPPEMSPERRKQCLWELKKLGFQTGAGFLVGSPGQTDWELAADLLFLQELRPQMAGIGPFIPHRDTPFAGEKAGSVDMTLRLISILRILLPDVLLPATTALGTLHPQGREMGILAGANVLMPVLTPPGIREKYELYEHKSSSKDEAGRLGELAERVEKIGYRLAAGRGDHREIRGDIRKSADR